MRRLTNIPIWPAAHYVTPKEKMDKAIQEIYKEMEERVAYFEKEKKLIEAQRIRQRTMYDIEMMRRWAIAPASRITPGSLKTGRWVLPLRRCWIISPRIF